MMSYTQDKIYMKLKKAFCINRIQSLNAINTYDCGIQYKTTH